MNSEQDRERVLAVLKVIWLALLGSLAVYAVVGRFAAPRFVSPLSGEGFAIIRFALLALGAVTLLAVRYVRRLILAPKGPSAGPASLDRPALLQRYSSAVIASLTMSESVGIYGLILFLLGKSELDLYLPIAISAAAMYHFRPRREELSDLMQRGS